MCSFYCANGCVTRFNFFCPSDIRLVSGPNRCSGRIEVFHNKQWGTVCDSGWDKKDAEVVCRELGCGNALRAPGAARYNQGSGTIWLERVNCTGKEETLIECPKSAWGEHTCDHSQDASVDCSGNLHSQVERKEPYLGLRKRF